MERSRLFFVGALALLLSLNANAQSKIGADYFNGKWSVLLKGLPDGDSRMGLVLENRNDSIVGIVLDSLGVEIAKISSAVLKDNEVTLYFSTQGYDVNLLMTRKDDDHTTGNLMNMFDVEGERIKDVKK